MTNTLPAVPRIALHLLGRPLRQPLRQAAEWFLARSAELAHALPRGGTAFQQTLTAIQRGIRESTDTSPCGGLTPSRRLQMLDAITTCLLHGRYRDTTQIQTLYHQTGGLLLAHLSDTANLDQPDRRILTDTGVALARAELLRRFHDGLRAGRLYIPESEITRCNVDLIFTAQGRISPQFQDLMTAQARHTREQLHASTQRLTDIPHPQIRRFLHILITWQLEMLTRFEATGWRASAAQTNITALHAAIFVWKTRNNPPE